MAGFARISVVPDVGIRCVIGHPDDVVYIGTLQDHGRQLKVKIRYGPYRNNREPGFFDRCGRARLARPGVLDLDRARPPVR